MQLFGINFADTFDTTSALSGMYLWLLFGFLSSMINCDLQRFLVRHQHVKHLVAFVAFFFLFTLIDTNNKTTILNIWIKTFVVYLLFVLTTKSKWYFALPVLGFLLIDQSIKKHISLSKAQGKMSEDKESSLNAFTRFINVVVSAMIITGAIHYVFLQKAEYGKQFSWMTFFLGTSTCKK